MDLNISDFSDGSKATPPIETGASTDPKPEIQQTRKRRGRPFGARTAVPPLEETTVRADGEPPTDSGTQTRKRRSKSVDVSELAKQLRGIHSLAANIIPIRMPDGSGGSKLLLELSDTEATQLATAISGIAKEYDLAIDGKTGAAIQLFAAAAMIYGPRIYVIQKIRTSHQQQQRQQTAEAAPDATVVAEQGLNGHATAN
jgi:hypothetical protein